MSAADGPDRSRMDSDRGSDPSEADTIVSGDAPSRARSAAPQDRPERTGRYPILRELGRGGMGVVYLAEDPSLGRRIALKRLPDAVSGDPDRLERFRQEARLLAAVNHPNIATIFSLEEADGASFLTMEAIEGETLRERLSRSRLTLRESLEVARQIARALETAHRQSIVHRDLKPGNVMLAEDLGVKVLDFGLAVSRRPEVQSASMRGTIAGTPGYMSPEQLEGSDPDVRSDVWSFGCVLYECLCGAPVIEGTETSDLIARTLACTVDFQRLPTDVPEPLRAVLRQCLARTVAERCATLTEPRRVIEELLAEIALHKDRADERNATSTPNNLPSHAASFVGRARELDEVVRLLGTHRVVSLTGFGGVGKTRLALRAAESMLADYEGVWFVDVAPLRSASDIAAAIVSSLRIPEKLDRPLIDSIAQHVAERREVFVLDNCEHVVEGAAELVSELGRRTRGLRFLVTSRERLGIDGEMPYPVPVFDVPGAGTSVDPSAAERFTSVQLFLQRARQAGADLALNASTTATIVEICRRLDGIPLAIELAASRLRALPLDDLLRRLDDRFRLLTGGTRTGLAHHRTLRALIDWSYEQLDPAEQTLLARLSVFAGGWTLGAAETVGAGGPVHDWDVLDLLTRLVDKSLVESEAGADGGTLRFRMLETVRAYAAERLEASGELSATQARHRDAFIAFVARAEPELAGKDLMPWLARLNAEHENVRRAFASCIEPGADPRLGIRLAAPLFRFWMLRGHWNEGKATSLAALEHAKGLEPDVDTVKVLNSLCAIAYFHGRLDEARAYGERTVEMAERLGARQGVGSGQLNLGNVAYSAGDYETAERRYLLSLEAFREIGFLDGWCRCLINLGNINFARGDYESLRRYATEAAERATELGHAELLGYALVALGSAHLRTDRLDEARACYERVLELQKELGDERNALIATVNLAVVAHRQQQLFEALGLFKGALAGFARLGDPASAASALEGLSALSADFDDLESAVVAYGAADAIRARIHVPRVPDEEHVVRIMRDGFRKALTEEEIERLSARGRAMDVGAAVAWALETIGPAT